MWMQLGVAAACIKKNIAVFHSLSAQKNMEVLHPEFPFTVKTQGLD